MWFSKETIFPHNTASKAGPAPTGKETMLPIRKSRAHTLFVAACASMTVAPALAQSWPAKPIRVVIPFSASGATDIPGHIVTDRLSDAFRHQVIVENRPGAGSTLGASLVAKAPPDGYTLLITATTHVPETPTIAEGGVPGYNAELWHGVLAPKGTPAEIVGRLHGEITRALKLPEVQSRFLASGNDVVATNPEQFGALLRPISRRGAK